MALSQFYTGREGGPSAVLGKLWNLLHNLHILDTAVSIEGLLLKLFKRQQLEQRNRGLESQPCYLTDGMP